MEIFEDKTGEVYEFVTKNLKYKEGIKNDLTIGIKCSNKGLVAGLIYSIDNNVTYLTIYAINPRWCSKKILTKIFTIPFGVFKTKSIKLLTSHKNKKVNKLLWGLKLREEGYLRFARPEDGSHLRVFAIEEKELVNKWWYNGE